MQKKKNVFVILYEDLPQVTVCAPSEGDQSKDSNQWKLTPDNSVDYQNNIFLKIQDTPNKWWNK